MSKATIAKLTVLIFLAFIVCLPEFFPSAQQVLFLCAPFDPCDPNNGHGHYDDQAGITQPRCEAQNEAVEHWFVCETHTDLQSLRDNATISEKDLEVIVTLQIAAPSLLQNMTINGHVNHSRIYTETHHDIMLFGCCIQNESTQQNKDKTSNRSSYSTPCSRNNSDLTHRSNVTYCLARLEDIQGMSLKTVNWWCVSTIAWLILVLLVIVLVFLGVRDQIFKNKHCCKKKVKPVQPSAKQLETYKRRVKYVSLGENEDEFDEEVRSSGVPAAAEAFLHHRVNLSL
ncbi:hypothetical protein Baya_9824 [Bagarius yarrelli]|uniref:Uncharacterized protein n=1 Tax=Bagarius yarrelli TaxID=175774 RepID=A0A556U8F3_BAGYA|nr:hypothetical protein Baya_9824 [Bagarius yarrelli]